MSENEKEVLINFVKYNKFYKDKKDGRLIMSMNIGAKEILDKAIKNLLDIVEKKDAIIDEMTEFILRHCNDLKLFCENKSETYCQTMYEHYNCLKCIKDYFEMRCK